MLIMTAVGVLHRSERIISSRGRGEDRGCDRRRCGAPGGEASSHPRRILVGEEGGPVTELTSNPAATTGGPAPPAMGTPAVLALFEEARLGAELTRRAFFDWDKLMLRDLLPNPVADQY
ncbi:hypothetical protein U1Q18_012326 [Sarracenia purpurea var. burkii]